MLTMVSPHYSPPFREARREQNIAGTSVSSEVVLIRQPRERYKRAVCGGYEPWTWVDWRDCRWLIGSR